eukprot:CAMPEP_0202693184 /NCGR_PEP_ID=MMETSP1385-20130828/7368_1 /ASSEMBLY_ACC=CAM_ASM_000861 /TAXON_ID=933848 /ORGANISM="Elphidium margaritaceum" /LENGTH=636 /DNA_ID=CAMNT_0049348831 /DNA_START=116 /DNA_END=2026 /DNA_ORIENTATION=-
MNNNLARHSMAGGHHNVLQNNMNMNNRRSSIMMQSMKMSKDPRPLKDKQWIEQQLQRLIEYLCSHGYDASMLSPKELNPPSTKNFQCVCCFLFQQIDPTFLNLFNAGNIKFEDECISFFEKLGYPFKMNKSSLRCIAPHSWPPLLGAIAWLIELLLFAESFEDNIDAQSSGNDPRGGGADGNKEDDDLHGDEAKTNAEDRLFLNLIAENYGLWLKGVEDDDHITVKLMTVFDEKIESTTQDIDRFQKANQQLNKEIERIKQELPSMSDLQDQRQNTLSAVAEVQKIKQQRAQYIEMVNKKYMEWEQKVSEKVAKIEHNQRSIEELKATISRQTISPKDVQMMNRESIALHEKKDELQLQKEETKRKQYDVSESIQNVSKAVKDAMLEHNELGAKIQIIPSTAKYSFGHDHVLKLREELVSATASSSSSSMPMSIAKATDLCNQKDFDNFDLLQKLIYHYNDKLRKCEANMTKEQGSISQIKSDLQIKKNEIEILNDRLSNVVQLYNEEKAKMSLMTANTARSIEKVELSMNAQSNDIEAELKSKKKELIEASNQYSKLFEQCRKMEIQVTSKVGIALQKVVKHRQHLRKTLKDVNQRVDEALDKVAFYHIQEPTLVLNASHLQNNENMTVMDIDDD